MIGSEKKLTLYPEISKVWVLSSFHMPGGNAFNDVSFTYYNYEYGVNVVSIPSISIADVPKWLKPIISMAKKIDVDEIRFDRDGRTVSILTLYDDEW